jgi:cephalosporin hydroxylase
MTHDEAHATARTHDSDEHQIGQLEIYEIYKRSPYLTVKHSSYFQVYTDLLEEYRHRPVTFIEVGVKDGGSLFMWRDYFGSKARIIGIDLNPLAMTLREQGFEIFVGNQADPAFWDSFFRAIGPVDIVLDDGGHTFEQQIVTAHGCIPRIRDGGLMIVEDTHTSYLKEFGYPTKYSFIEWTKTLIDKINSRFPEVKVSGLPYKRSVYSISIFESIVCFRIQRAKCFESSPTSNDGTSLGAEDLRYQNSSVGRLRKLMTHVARRFPGLKDTRFARIAWRWIFSRYAAMAARRKLRRLGEYF